MLNPASTLALIASLSVLSLVPQSSSKVDRLAAHIFDATMDLRLFEKYTRGASPKVIADLEHARQLVRAAVRSQENPQGPLRSRREISQIDRKLGLECGKTRLVGDCRLKDADMKLDLLELTLDHQAGRGQAAISVHAGRTDMLSAIAVLSMVRIEGEWRVAGLKKYMMP